MIRETKIEQMERAQKQLFHFYLMNKDTKFPKAKTTSPKAFLWSDSDENQNDSCQRKGICFVLKGLYKDWNILFRISKTD